MESFFETLNYSSSNEDSSSEIRALDISDRDSILCITGSGARTLDLLITKPAKVVSVDVSPCQNFLLELKMAAIQCLDYEEFLEFLGIHLSSRRRFLYKRIRQSLSTEARNFWDTNFSIVEKGVIYQGRWEKYFRKLAQILCLIRPCLLKKLFSCNTVSDQYKTWHDDWDDALWCTFLRFISLRPIWKYIFGDPGFYRFVPNNTSIYNYLHERFNSAFGKILARQSPFANLLFFGNYNVESVLPLHLQRKYYATLQTSLCDVRIVTQSLSEYLQQCGKEQFDKFSLSDFSSYTNMEEYERTWMGILKTARRGARICERQFLAKREIPSVVAPYFRRSEALEQDLLMTDNSIFYTFIIAVMDGEIND